MTRVVRAEAKASWLRRFRPEPVGRSFAPWNGIAGWLCEGVEHFAQGVDTASLRGHQHVFARDSGEAFTPVIDVERARRFLTHRTQLADCPFDVLKFCVCMRRRSQPRRRCTFFAFHLRHPCCRRAFDRAVDSFDDMSAQCVVRLFPNARALMCASDGPGLMRPLMDTPKGGVHAPSEIAHCEHRSSLGIRGVLNRLLAQTFSADRALEDEWR